VRFEGPVFAGGLRCGIGEDEKEAVRDTTRADSALLRELA
jgi:hypothetical protein